MVILTMNKTEEKAFNWLTKIKGIKKEEIVYQHNRSPDFIIGGKKGYEVKRIYGRNIIIYSTQYNQMKEYGDIDILLFYDNNNKPEAIIPLKEITPETKTWKQFKINYVQKGEYYLNIHLDDNYMEKFKDLKRLFKYDNNEEAFKNLLIIAQHYVKQKLFKPSNQQNTKKIQ